MRQGGWFSFDKIDLSGVREIHIKATIGEGSKSEFNIFQNSLTGNRIGSVQLVESPGPGPQEGSRFATATLSVNSLYFGNIVCTIDSDSEEDLVGAFISMEFKKIAITYRLQ